MRLIENNQGMENRSMEVKTVSRSKAEREEIIEGWRQSGKSKKMYCRENGLNYMTFISWMSAKKNRRKKAFAAKDGFVPLQIRSNASSLFAEVACSNGSVITLHQVVGVEYLRMLAR